MPNWVFNTLTVEGTDEDLARFAEQAALPYERKYKSFNPETEKYDWVTEEVTTDLSFWNFVRPDDSALDEYYGAESQGLSLEEKLQFKTNHWYDWNVRNWGCKWDASDVYADSKPTEYEFSTPWSPPVGALEAMSSQYPTLVFDLTSIEEQGWGVEYIADQDGVRVMREWDIPDTHEDSMEHKGWCNCEEMNAEEAEWMYDDCPKKMESVNV